MSTIPKPGDLVLIKTTEEPVIVLEAIELTGQKYKYPLPSKILLSVRRPVAGQNGIFYQVDTFYLEEVEFPNDRNSRLRAEYVASLRTEDTKESPAATDSESKSSVN